MCVVYKCAQSKYTNTPLHLCLSPLWCQVWSGIRWVSGLLLLSCCQPPVSKKNLDSQRAFNADQFSCRLVSYSVFTISLWPMMNLSLTGNDLILCEQFWLTLSNPRFLFDLLFSCLFFFFLFSFSGSCNCCCCCCSSSVFSGLFQLTDLI